MPGEIKKLARFLEIDIDPSKWDAIFEHCSFDYMKKHSTKSVPLGGAFWDGGSDTFVNKGTEWTMEKICLAKKKATAMKRWPSKISVQSAPNG